jgi:toxin ParE1/3/4
MAEVRWTPQAVDDLDAIADHIARDSPQYSSLFVMDVFYAVDRLTQFPQSGRIVPELNDAMVREIILGSYRIIYRRRHDLVEILTVYHGSRLLDPSKLN